MFTVTKELKFCCAHRLLQYKGPCACLHGHNYKVLVTVAGKTLDELDMVTDFSTVKKYMQSWLDTNYDHRVILNATDPIIQFLRDTNNYVTTTPGNPTAELMAKSILKEATMMIKNLQLKVTVASVRVYETDTSYAEVNSCE